MGTGRWFQTTWVRDHRGKRRQMKCAGTAEPVEVSYPALVSPEEWHAANSVGNEGRTCAVRADADRYLLYGGMVRCGEHDKAMTGSSGNLDVRYYRCQRRVHPGGRTNHSVRARDLEEAVWATVKSAMLDESRMVEAAERLAREAEAGMEDGVQRLAVIEARLRELERETTWVYTEMRKVGASAVQMARQVDLIEDERRRLLAEREQIRARVALCREDLPRAQEVRAICQAFVRNAEGADAVTKRQLLEDRETTVVMDGLHFRIDGVLTVLGLEGELCAHSPRSSR